MEQQQDAHVKLFAKEGDVDHVINWKLNKLRLSKQAD